MPDSPSDPDAAHPSPGAAVLRPGQHIHIVGVGGFGMSAIARVLLQQGYTVSGSDLRANAFTQALSEAGATIYEGHAADHIAGADLVVATSAATSGNPEVAAAQARGIPVLRRRDLLGALMAGHTGIAIAGTHGKTTTTALMAHTLMTAGLSPSYIVGGVMRNTGDNAGVGSGAYFVIEADEYDYMFLGLRPHIAAILNIEHDHPDMFPTQADVIDAFARFAGRLERDGLLVACADDPAARALAEARRDAGHPALTYALDAPADWTATDLEPLATGGTRFVAWRGGQRAGALSLSVPGRHNVLNGLAVLAIAAHLDVPFEAVGRAFASFQGTGRRGEVLGAAGGVTVVSDYGHHPTAIRVTLAAFRERPGIRDLWAVWQPHTFGRMRALADEFAGAFGAADHVLVTDVYSVREAPAPGLDAPGMAARIAAQGHADARYSGDFAATVAALEQGVRPGDWVIILSAGDAPTIGERLLARLAAGEQST